MRASSSAIVAGVIVYVASFAFVACTGGSDSGTISSSSSGSGGTSNGGSSSGDSRQPGESCVIERDADSTSSSSRVCAVNPLHGGCRMCLELENDEMTCLYACTLGGSDCPSGQTCTAQPGGSSDTQGECDGLGYCK